MKYIIRNIVIISVMVVGVTIIGSLIYFDQETSQENSMGFVDKSIAVKDPDITSNQLMEEVDQNSLNIAPLQEDTNKSFKNNINRRISQLDHELELLRDQLNSLSENISALTVSEDVIADEYLDTALIEEEEERQLKAQIERQLALYSYAAQQEGIDRAWAPTAETELLESFQAIAEDGIVASDVLCHSSFCQAYFSLDNYSDKALQKIQDLSPWAGETFIWIEDTNQGEGVVYLARDGYNLPHSNEQM